MSPILVVSKHCVADGLMSSVDIVLCRRDGDFGKCSDRHNCRRRVQHECVSGGYLEEVGKADIVATCIPIAHGRPTWNQTVGNLGGATNNYWNTTIFIGFRSHSIEKKRI